MVSMMMKRPGVQPALGQYLNVSGAIQPAPNQPNHTLTGEFSFVGQITDALSYSVATAAGMLDLSPDKLKNTI